MSIETILLRLFTALVCGIFLGLDREIKSKPLGLRAFTLIALGSAGFSIIAVEFAYLQIANDQSIKIDPTRVIQGIVSGIGFIGAGAIIQSKDTIRGTATGAGIWVAGAVGIACGYGMLKIALVITIFSFITLTLLEYVSKKIHDVCD